MTYYVLNGTLNYLKYTMIHTVLMLLVHKTVVVNKSEETTRWATKNASFIFTITISYKNLFNARKLRPKTQSEARPDKVLVVHVAAEVVVS